MCQEFIKEYSGEEIIINKKRIQKYSSILVAFVLIFKAGILPIYAAGNMEQLEAETVIEQEEIEKEAEDETIVESETTEAEIEGEISTESAASEGMIEEDTSVEENIPEDMTKEDISTEDAVLENDIQEEILAPGDEKIDQVEDASTEDVIEAAIEPLAYDADAAKKLEDELSKNGNKVTQYVNEEDQKLKTIVWAKGVTPPEMSDFIKETDYGNQGMQYVTYKTPYQSNKGWYDVNKTINRVEDANLCFAVAASNALHWWLEQNGSYIDRYLAQYPDDPKKQELQTLRNSFVNQQDSAIYRRYVKQFSRRQEGYWADILVDQFINGYVPKENGAINHSEADRDNLVQKGPSPLGGFFYDIFGTTLLTDRTYSGDFQSFSNKLKGCFVEGDLVLLSYDTKVLNHVVTLWGAEYDADGQISAVYLTDSDDETSQYAMVRYMVKNLNGRPILSTNINGMQGSSIEYMQMVSLGQETWEKRLQTDPNAPKIPLVLEWGNTEFTYNGRTQKPLVHATNIDKDDDVVLLVEGEQKDAGNHTAQVILKGASASKYQLPLDGTREFVIKKARARVKLSATSHLNQENKFVDFNISVTGINNSEKPTGTITLKTGQQVIKDQIPVVNGEASYHWTNLPLGNHRITAEFYPSADGVGKNYENAVSNAVQVKLPKKEQSRLDIVPVTDKKFGDGSFTLQTTGGTGNGTVTYSCNTNDVLSISGSTATIIGAGTTTITAVKDGDADYESTTAAYTITVAKASAPVITYPIASSLVYGQKLSESTLSGGSIEYGSFVWDNGELIPTIQNGGYTVRFVPSADTLKNYETIAGETSTVNVLVSRANPVVTLDSKVVDEKGSRKVILSASVGKVPYGDEVTGTVTFINCTDVQDTEIVSSISVINGVATYVWSDMPQQLYKIKAVYSGDKNYNSASASEISVDVGRVSEENHGSQNNNAGNNNAENNNAENNNAGHEDHVDNGKPIEKGNNQNNNVGKVSEQKIDALDEKTNEKPLSTNLKVDDAQKNDVVESEDASTSDVQSEENNENSQNTSEEMAVEKEQSEEKKKDGDRKKVTSKVLLGVSLGSVVSASGIAAAFYFKKFK